MKKNISHRNKKKRRILKRKLKGGSASIPKIPPTDTTKFYPKAPVHQMLNYILHTFYTIAGIFIYYPTFLLNLPDSTLESIVPTEGGCQTLFGDPLWCKSKLKCFFKKCSIIEDPIGYKLRRESQLATRKDVSHKSKRIQALQVGGMNKKKHRITQKRHKKYMRYIPPKVKKMMKRSMKKDMNNFLKLIRSIYGKKRQKGGSTPKSMKNVLSKHMTPEMKQKMTNKAQNFIAPSMINSVSSQIKEPTSIHELKNKANEVVKDLGVNAVSEKTGLPKSIVKLGANSIASEDESKYLDQETCVNKSNYRKCSTNTNVDYNIDETQNKVLQKLLFGKTEEERQKETATKTVKRMNALATVGKTDKNSLPSSDIIEDFFESQLDGESLYKMLMMYKMLDSTFNENVSDETLQEYNESMNVEMTGVDVAFPWKTKNAFTSMEDRRKCLFAHLTQSNLGDDYKSNDLYEKCFVCKNCTLANTTMSALEQVFADLFSSSAKEFEQISHDMFNIISKHFKFELMPIKQYYVVSLLSMMMIDPALDPSKLDIVIDLNEKQYYLRDLILGIPKFNMKFDMSSQIKDKLFDSYKAMKLMDLDRILYNVCYKIKYKIILKEMSDLKKLHEIKKQLQENIQVFYGKQKLYRFTDENQITHEMLKPFNIYRLSSVLQQAKEDENRHSSEDVAREIHDIFRRDFSSLYELILDTAKYDDVTAYTSNTNFSTLVPQFKEIIFQINGVDGTK